jgi:hypothetical protein
MKKRIFVIVLFLSNIVFAQNYTEFHSKIIDKDTQKPVSYAHIKHKTLKIVTQANNEGVFVFKVPNQFIDDSLVITCVSYAKRTIAIKELAKLNHIELKPDPVQLQSITINALPSGESILKKVKANIKNNYYTDTTINTFFYRDYRIIDNNMYLFNEAVFEMLRQGVAKYKWKILVSFNGSRALKNNYKKAQKYRLLVYDTLAIDSINSSDVNNDGLLNYYDENFSDMMDTPNAGLILGHIKWFNYNVFAFKDNDDNRFYKIIATPKASKKERLIMTGVKDIEMLINANDYALISIKSNFYYAKIEKTFIKINTSDGYAVTSYSKVGEKYTLTSSEVSCKSLIFDEEKKPHTVTYKLIYNLTDLSIDTTKIRSFFDDAIIDTKSVRFDKVFNESDYNEDFWQQYNFIPLDADIEEKLTKILKKSNNE